MDGVSFTSTNVIGGLAVWVLKGGHVDLEGGSKQLRTKASHRQTGGTLGWRPFSEADCAAANL